MPLLILKSAGDAGVQYAEQPAEAATGDDA